MSEWRSTSKAHLLNQGDLDGRSENMPLFYDIHVFCCVNERPPKHRRGCCSGKSALLLCDYMCRRTMAMGLREIRVNRAGCLNRCEMGPVMVIYPEGIWYSYATEKDIDEIVRSHIIGGKKVERLLLSPDQGPRH
jgi:(2Fe-2S) ferredoxin|tara:strand:+ start:10472 stop:10876 length:405 start_codon:yes stop_codon:yes gene_type:complete